MDVTQVVKVETAYSEEDTIIKGVPQGGPMSPIIFRDYTMDIIMAIFDSQDWRDGEKEDKERIEKHIAEGTPMGVWGGEVSERSLTKEIKDKEDKWDLRIAFEKKYEMFRMEEKTGIGPERRQVEKYEGSSRATLYADDSSARESAKTLGELKEKTERMLTKLFNIMRKNRLAVNTGKTQILCLRTPQKKRWMKENNDPGNLKLKIEGKEIEEKSSGKLLGLIYSKWHCTDQWRE